MKFQYKKKVREAKGEQEVFPFARKLTYAANRSLNEDPILSDERFYFNFKFSDSFLTRPSSSCLKLSAIKL